MPWLHVGLLLLVLFGMGCGRPFVEMEPPAISVAVPDLSVIIDQETILLQIEAASPRMIVRVTVDGDTLERNPQTGRWHGTVSLDPGLNAIRITAEDEDGMVGSTTAYAMRLTARTSPFAPTLPQPRGGHTATRLLDGSVLITGGASRRTELASRTAYLLPPDGQAIEPLLAQLLTGRAGHTATLLPDGDVLIAGGALTDAVASLDELIETVERYDAETQTFVPMGFRGQPIRRAHHTAVLRIENGQVLLDLYGGRGDIRYGDTPRLGIREDVRTFEITADSVIAQNSLASAPRLLSVDGHIEAPLAFGEPGALTRYLVAGTSFGTQVTDSVSFLLNYTTMPRITFDDDLPTLRLSRTRHAAATVAPGMVAILGGYQPGATPEEIARTELYVDEARQYFLFPESPALQRRFGHTATFFPPNRILLSGGFFSSGSATSFAEYLELDL